MFYKSHCILISLFGIIKWIVLIIVTNVTKTSVLPVRYDCSELKMNKNQKLKLVSVGIVFETRVNMLHSYRGGQF